MQAVVITIMQIIDHAANLLCSIIDIVVI